MSQDIVPIQIVDPTSYANQLTTPNTIAATITINQIKIEIKNGIEPHFLTELLKGLKNYAH